MPAAEAHTKLRKHWRWYDFEYAAVGERVSKSPVRSPPNYGFHRRLATPTFSWRYVYSIRPAKRSPLSVLMIRVSRSVLGWLRASHRKLDHAKSLPYRPWHSHDEQWPLIPGELVELDVEIWPTCIVAPPGYQLAFTVRGRDYEVDGSRDAALPNAPYPMKGVGPFLHIDVDDRPPAVFSCSGIPSTLRLASSLPIVANHSRGVRSCFQNVRAGKELMKCTITLSLIVSTLRVWTSQDRVRHNNIRTALRPLSCPIRLADRLMKPRAWLRSLLQRNSSRVSSSKMSPVGQQSSPTNRVARAVPDGYTLLLHNLQISANAALYKTLPFDTAKDLELRLSLSIKILLF